MLDYWKEDYFIREYGNFGRYVASKKLKNDIIISKHMKKYIAFLRGINVGKIRIKMPDLKLAFENLDFQQVKSYLQTGNVVFESDKTNEIIKSLLEKKLSDTFHYEAHVLLYNFDFLVQTVAQYPFERDESHHAYIILLITKLFLKT